MTTGAQPMAKRGRGGRPRKEDGDSGTRGVRVYTDLAVMIGWVILIDGVKSAELLDPLIRPQIAARYAAIEPAVEKIKQAEEEAQKYRKKPKGKPE